jgi:hypothetical protein
MARSDLDPAAIRSLVEHVRNILRLVCFQTNVMKNHFPLMIINIALARSTRLVKFAHPVNSGCGSADNRPTGLGRTCPSHNFLRRVPAREQAGRRPREF